MEKNKYKLTVIIPTFNRSAKLKKTLPKLLKNKNKNICFLILNNNSTDDTINLVNKFKKKDKRIILHTHKNNIGAANNFRFGMKYAKTPYVTLVSDDDYLLGDYFETCLNIFEKNPQVGFINQEYGRIKLKKDSYKLFKAGLKASIEGYRYASMLSGISFRKKLLNFKKYPLKKDKIYSYLSQILPITEKFDYVKIESSSFYPLKKISYKDQASFVKTSIKIQNRPDDYGISEISDYVFISQFSYYQKLRILSTYLSWFIFVGNNIPKKIYKNFLLKTKISLGDHFIFFYIHLLFSRFNWLILKFLFINILNPMFFLRNFYNGILFLKFTFKYIFKK